MCGVTVAFAFGVAGRIALRISLDNCTRISLVPDETRRRLPFLHPERVRELKQRASDVRGLRPARLGDVKRLFRELGKGVLFSKNRRRQCFEPRALRF